MGCVAEQDDPAPPPLLEPGTAEEAPLEHLALTAREMIVCVPSSKLANSCRNSSIGAGSFVLINLVIDLLYVWIDPRIDYKAS